MIEVAKAIRKDIAQCLSIVESLPEYFTPKALVAMKQDLGRRLYVESGYRSSACS